MEALVVQSAKGQDVTTSLIVAEVFGKEHKHVLRDIQNLSCSESFRQSNFGHTPYTHPQNGQQYPMYEMTKDGFSFLVMGYTGGKAAEFKEKFIAEFNKREALLKNDDFILSRAFSIMGERNKQLEAQVAAKEEQLQLVNETVKQQAPMVAYYNEVLQSDNGHAVTAIAQDFNLSAITLNRKLKQLGVQWKVGGEWMLTAKYLNKGYAFTKKVPVLSSNGEPKTVLQLVWTEKGRQFIHSLLDTKATA